MCSIGTLYEASRHVYELRTNPDAIECKQIGNFKLIDSQYDSVSGHGAAAYYNQESRELVVAHRGTVLSSWKDLQADWQIGKHEEIGRTNADVAALAYTDAIVDQCKINGYPIDHAYFTGHSKGGHEAQVCTAVLARNPPPPCSSVTFNAPGISSKNVDGGDYPHVNLRSTGLLYGDQVSKLGGEQLGKGSLDIPSSGFTVVYHGLDSFQSAIDSLGIRDIEAQSLIQAYKEGGLETQGTLAALGNPSPQGFSESNNIVPVLATNDKDPEVVPGISNPTGSAGKTESVGQISDPDTPLAHSGEPHPHENPSVESKDEDIAISSPNDSTLLDSTSDTQTDTVNIANTSGSIDKGRDTDLVGGQQNGTSVTNDPSQELASSKVTNEDVQAQVEHAEYSNTSVQIDEVAKDIQSEPISDVETSDLSKDDLRTIDAGSVGKLPDQEFSVAKEETSTLDAGQTSGQSIPQSESHSEGSGQPSEPSATSAEVDAPPALCATAEVDPASDQSAQGLSVPDAPDTPHPSSEESAAAAVDVNETPNSTQSVDEPPPLESEPPVETTADAPTVDEPPSLESEAPVEATADAPTVDEPPSLESEAPVEATADAPTVDEPPPLESEPPVETTADAPTVDEPPAMNDEGLSSSTDAPLDIEAPDPCEEPVQPEEPESDHQMDM